MFALHPPNPLLPNNFLRRRSRQRQGMISLMLEIQGVKSIILIFYQLLTENLQRFSRWSSSKANMIINCLEVSPKFQIPLPSSAFLLLVLFLFLLLALPFSFHSSNPLLHRNVILTNPSTRLFSGPPSYFSSSKQTSPAATTYPVPSPGSSSVSQS